MTDDAEHLERLRREREVRAAPAPSRARRAGLLGLVAIALAVLGKLKGVLGALKFLSLGKVLTTGGTMVLSIWAYAFAFGLPFAAGFVLLIFVHEMGHAVWIRRHGLRAGAPVFIPFVGAMIALKDQPRDAVVEAEIAIAGPIAGGLAAAACWGLGSWTGRPIFHALAYSGFFLNLFNCLPVSPLDGGRVAAAISRWLWVAGLAAAVPLALWSLHPILIVILVLGTVRAIKSFRGPEREQAYYAIPPRTRWAIAGVYFYVVVTLALGAAVLHRASTG
ncbi:MAG TPA: site-2 protease family protein [Candidatus Polarisedimenticolaceae bacterium]